MVDSATMEIRDVSDTAIWVAHYRAKETERTDALFSDPLAKRLVGDRGKKIAEQMRSIGRYTEWTVVIRTGIIDEFVTSQVSQGIDTVINLGAGLDTRPYRMNLPKSLRWIEADFPHVIAFKNRELNGETPHCQLTRVGFDLTDEHQRRKFLNEFCLQAKNVLVLTEGVIPYLSENQVDQLLSDLRAHPAIRHFVAEYLSPDVYRHLKSRLRVKKMKNAPFQFFPNDWIGFFGQRGWTPAEIRYAGNEGAKCRRPMPIPTWAKVLQFFASSAQIARTNQMTGFILFRRKLEQEP